MGDEVKQLLTTIDDALQAVDRVHEAEQTITAQDPKCARCRARGMTQNWGMGLGALIPISVDGVARYYHKRCYHDERGERGWLPTIGYGPFCLCVRWKRPLPGDVAGCMSTVASPGTFELNVASIVCQYLPAVTFVRFDGICKQNWSELELMMDRAISVGAVQWSYPDGLTERRIVGGDYKLIEDLEITDDDWTMRVVTHGVAEIANQRSPGVTLEHIKKLCVMTADRPDRQAFFFSSDHGGAMPWTSWFVPVPYVLGEHKLWRDWRPAYYGPLQEGEEYDERYSPDHNNHDSGSDGEEEAPPSRKRPRHGGGNPA